MVCVQICYSKFGRDKDVASTTRSRPQGGVQWYGSQSTLAGRCTTGYPRWPSTRDESHVPYRDIANIPNGDITMLRPSLNLDI
jgi:hypothetical protein